MGEGAAGMDTAVVKTLAITPSHGVLGRAILDPRGFRVDADGGAQSDDALELLGNPSYWEIRPQQKELLEICEANAERLLLLINDNLDFSKLDANRMTLDLQPTQLAEVCRNAATNMRSLLEKKKLDLHLEL